MQKFLIIICLLFIVAGVSLAQDETPTPYDVALERILEAERTGAMLLDLTWLGLKELPPEIGNLSSLQTLALVGNKLSYLPPEIGSMESLERLDIAFNQFRRMPPELFHLDQLISLSLRENQLTDLPPEIKNLTSLTILDVTCNQLHELPPEIGELRELKFLMLSHNLLEELPPEIGNLANLCGLAIENNQIRTLPRELGKLSKLDSVESCNYSWIGLDWHGNPLISPPPEVIVRGTPAILDYLNHQAEWHLRRLVISAATGIGLLILLILGLRWRMGRKARKSKQKREFV